MNFAHGFFLPLLLVTFPLLALLLLVTFPSILLLLLLVTFPLLPLLLLLVTFPSVLLLLLLNLGLASPENIPSAEAIDVRNGVALQFHKELCRRKVLLVDQTRQWWGQASATDRFARTSTEETVTSTVHGLLRDLHLRIELITEVADICQTKIAKTKTRGNRPNFQILYAGGDVWEEKRSNWQNFREKQKQKRRNTLKKFKELEEKLENKKRKEAENRGMGDDGDENRKRKRRVGEGKCEFCYERADWETIRCKHRFCDEHKHTECALMHWCDERCPMGGHPGGWVWIAQ